MCADMLLLNATPFESDSLIWTLGVGGLSCCCRHVRGGEEPVSSMSTGYLKELTVFEGNHFTFSQKSFELPKK